MERFFFVKHSDYTLNLEKTKRQMPDSRLHICIYIFFPTMWFQEMYKTSFIFKELTVSLETQGSI